MNPFPLEFETSYYLLASDTNKNQDLDLIWLKEQIRNARPNSRGYLNDSMANPFPRIWVGSGEKLTRDLMNTFSITHVLNCADESACPYNIKAGLTSNNYMCINAIDSTDVDLFGTWYPIFKDTLDRYLRDTTCKNVFVHCQAGINRSATLTAGYVIKRFRVPFQACLSKMISQRPCILTNPAFQEQLVRFVKKSD